MRLFKVHTRAPELYQEADVNKLRLRVKQLEDVVEKYRTNRVPPFDVVVKIHAGRWRGIVHLLRQIADHAERYGPEMPAGGGGGSAGSPESQTSFSIAIQSGKRHGPGEGLDDYSEISP